MSRCEGCLPLSNRNTRGLPITPHFSYRHSREGGNPVPFVRERLKSLDSRFRGNDGWVARRQSRR
ncbi:hypothetical protein [Lysobacter gummosus]|uniref:hypothetical protein n=1 Tax=Lysobacter gummosus TaxID=262324 RepID=UPI00363968A9